MVQDNMPCSAYIVPDGICGRQKQTKRIFGWEAIHHVLTAWRLSFSKGGLIVSACLCGDMQTHAHELVDNPASFWSYYPLFDQGQLLMRQILHKMGASPRLTKAVVCFLSVFPEVVCFHSVFLLFCGVFATQVAFGASPSTSVYR